MDVLPERFERTEGFDLPTHWESYLDHFDRRRNQDTAILRLSSRGLDRLPELLEPAAVAARKTRAGPDPAGWTELEIPIESIEAAIPELLKFGADVEVVAPEALRAEVVRTLHAMNRTYGL